MSNQQAQTVEDLPTLENHEPCPSSPKGIPISKIIELRNKHLTFKEIGKIVGCSKQNVVERLQPYRQEIENLQSYKENRADVLAVVNSKILNSLSDEDIKNASAYQKVGMFGILYDKERLERGQATGITEHRDIQANIKDLMTIAKERGLDMPKLEDSQ